jgi:phosphopantothenoylcysteine synthetase/decarboxylase
VLRDYNISMRILVTAGNTETPIDRVRCLTNIFTARTGTAIASHAHSRGHRVTLMTSRPEAILELQPRAALTSDRWRPLRFRTFSDLENLMAQELATAGYDTVIHSAAVSDYAVAGVFAPVSGTQFSIGSRTWTGDPPALVDRGQGKVKSNEPELWLRLVPTPKLVDKVRTAWSFSGVLVKFKLEVGVSEQQLLEIAEQSRRHSRAELMVANTLEGAHEWAYLGPLDGDYERISRKDLPERLLDAIETKWMERMG